MKKHILIIEDDDQFREYLKILLKENGFFIDTSPNGKDAIKKIASAVPDLIITDIVMPDMDGLEIIKRIRQKISNIKIMAFSGGRRIKPEIYLDLSSKFKADCILKKPFKKNELLNGINLVLAE